MKYLVNAVCLFFAASMLAVPVAAHNHASMKDTLWLILIVTLAASPLIFFLN
jgi:hypothetical protein